MPNSTTAVSAPGKVLLAGGYLALDREYTAFVFGLSARINVIAQEIRTISGVQLSEIVVESPQFLDAQWRYGYHLAGEDGGIKVTQLHIGSTISSNPFVETTLSYVLTYISYATHQGPSHTIKPTRLTILADNDYYSQPHAESSSSSSSTTPPATSNGRPHRFTRFPTTLSGAHKTGLGSSAALVTALTAALLTHYLDPLLFNISSDEGKRVLHNLAQSAHCAAQGKVGSGFDVAAAVYGSCRYRRFSPSILSNLPEVGAPGFGTKLYEVVKGKARGGEIVVSWDTEVDKSSVSLQNGVAIRMCDVDCGSQTVGMVKKVLSWRQANEKEAKQLWDNLQAQNQALVTVLKNGDPTQIGAAVSAVRELTRQLGARSDVPIEPDSQSALLDALTERVGGVYGGVVPGAGGFDALALLVKDDKETIQELESFLASWSKEKGAGVKLLSVKGEMEGIRVEDAVTYNGWI